MGDIGEPYIQQEKRLHMYANTSQKGSLGAIFQAGITPSFITNSQHTANKTLFCVQSRPCIVELQSKEWLKMKSLTDFFRCLILSFFSCENACYITALGFTKYWTRFLKWLVFSEYWVLILIMQILNANVVSLQFFVFICAQFGRN